jgi:hypothetical protein
MTNKMSISSMEFVVTITMPCLRNHKYDPPSNAVMQQNLAIIHKCYSFTKFSSSKSGSLSVMDEHRPIIYLTVQVAELSAPASSSGGPRFKFRHADRLSNTRRVPQIRSWPPPFIFFLIHCFLIILPFKTM